MWHIQYVKEMRGISLCLNQQTSLLYLLAMWTTLYITIMYYGLCNDSYLHNIIFVSGINKHEAQLET